MPRHVLTIQSHVAYGHVGNSAAVFPLQLLGFSPIVVNTVQFSNHTSHPTTRGTVFDEKHIRDVILGVRERGLMGKCEGLLSGYLGDASVGNIVLELAQEIKQENPAAIWFCDPVMGDTDSGVFVRPDIPAFMKEKFLSGLADLTKPNQFELELLSGKKMRTRQEAVDTAREIFIDKGCRVAFVTSLLTPDVDKNSIETLAVTKDGAWSVRTPYLRQDPYPRGQGDVFSSVAFGTYLKTKDVKKTVEAAVSTLYALVKATPKGTLDLPLEDEQKQIVAPVEYFSAFKVD